MPSYTIYDLVEDDIPDGDFQKYRDFKKSYSNNESVELNKENKFCPYLLAEELSEKFLHNEDDSWLFSNIDKLNSLYVGQISDFNGWVRTIDYIKFSASFQLGKFDQSQPFAYTFRGYGGYEGLKWLQGKFSNTQLSFHNLTGLEPNLTRFGKKNYEAVKEIFDHKIITDFNDDIISYFEDQISEDFKKFILSESAFQSYLDRFLEVKGTKPRESLIQHNRLHKALLDDRAKTYTPFIRIYSSDKLKKVDFLKEPYHLANMFDLFITELTRDCENIFREKRGIPKVGEGWVNETNLYYEIKEAFSSHMVLHQHSPDWLSPQHLDIYFPKESIGVEYQGKQHNEPVEFFGGKESYRETVKRDKRKKELCENNGCKLFYVYPGYDIDDVKKRISEFL